MIRFGFLIRGKPWLNMMVCWRSAATIRRSGFYGVSIGRCFFGESMFAHAPDASKCAFATFARQIFAAGTPWIDCQVYTDHLARFGAKDAGAAWRSGGT